MMKYLRWLAVPALLVATPALAAPAPAYNWSGFYIGVHGGALDAGTSTSVNIPFDPTIFDAQQIYSVPGGAIGGFTGYNMQNGNFVFGIEGDASFVDLDGFSILDIVNQDEIFTTGVDWMASVRGRAGYAIQGILPYVTGGVAFARISNSYQNYATSARMVLDEPIVWSTETRTGYAVGAGVEAMATNNILLRAEYLFTDFGSQSLDLGGATFTFDNRIHSFRMGAAYKF